MSRKYPKKVRKEFARKLAAADAFVDAWTTSGMASTLIPDYDCPLGCSDAMTFAALLRAFGYVNTAEEILADHGEDCDYPHYHVGRGVWTFTLQPGGYDAESEGEYTVVADGESGAHAEFQATEFLRRKLKERYKTPVWIRVEEVESGVPASTALYAWTDLRKAA
ncbi:hypothetical protein OHB13_11970 [Streptomyces sp. NBC_00440]|uniref:hypothetical protein n=1 Tax=Streptomyces sp. NBC_00440 TaxID=2975741 RepID=UPI002E2332E8